MEKLYWNDPDPIQGINYEVTTLKHLQDNIYYITYNNGSSYSEVYAHELEVRKPFVCFNFNTMTLERRIYLVFTQDIDVRTLSFPEMMYYMKHNPFIYINHLYALTLI